MSGYESFLIFRKAAISWGEPQPWSGVVRKVLCRRYFVSLGPRPQRGAAFFLGIVLAVGARFVLYRSDSLKNAATACLVASL